MKLIDKDALVAEIYKLKNSHDNWSYMGKCFHQDYDTLLSLIDTLEVKEVDLEKEISNFLDNGMALQLDWTQCNIEVKPNGLRDFAKHFFELGLKASNPLTDIDISSMQDAYIKKMEIRGMKNEEAFIHSVSYVNGIKDVLTRFKALKGE